MAKNNSLQLSDVHNKVLAELEILTDVLASTFSEIGSVVKSHSKEIFELRDLFIKQNPSWRSTKQCWDVLYFPFVDSSDHKSNQIWTLRQFFCLTGRITLKNGLLKNKTSLNYLLSINWGFKFNNDKKDSPTKFFYVEIERQKTPDGVSLTENEYVNIANKIKVTIGIKEDNFFELDYPDDGGKERFYVWLDFKYSERLSDFFQICKNELIKEFFLRIGDKENIKKDGQKTKR